MNTVKQYEQQDKQKAEQKQALSLVEYNYFTPLKFLFKNENESNKIKLSVQKNSLSVFSGATTSTFYEELSDEDFMMEQYDVVYTSPSYNKDDIYGLTLVVDEGNRISRSIVDDLGIKLSLKPDGTYENISFETICNKEFKLLFNDDYYFFDADNNVTTLQDASQSELESLFVTTPTTLKINRVLRVKVDANFELLRSGVLFKKELGTMYRQDCKESIISQKQEQLKQTQTNNYTFYAPLQLNIAEFSGVLPSSFPDTNSINAFLNLHFKTTISIEDAYNLAMQQIGSSVTPQSLSFYAKNFDGKKDIQQMLDNYNKTAPKENKIVYSDQSQLITSTLGSIISIISYVLIAFASISLIVSSIMIGVITYTSVIERTKEIGVLRSLGARKKDVSRVFNAETTIIGALAGALGVVVSYLLCIPISAIISALAGISGIASLHIGHAFMLVLISTALSLVAGLVPSRYAAKKDPVLALRSE